jgi:hypothetical protein
MYDKKKQTDIKNFTMFAWERGAGGLSCRWEVSEELQAADEGRGPRHLCRPSAAFFCRRLRTSISTAAAPTDLSASRAEARFGRAEETWIVEEIVGSSCSYQGAGEDRETTGSIRVIILSCQSE